MKWLLRLKPWLAPVLVLTVVASIGGVWTHGYMKGKSAERTMHQLRLAAAQEDARLVQERLADELEAARADRRIVYRDRIRTVEREPDPSGCADIRLPDGMLEALRGDRDGR
jgi:hypothetical protein